MTVYVGLKPLYVRFYPVFEVKNPTLVIVLGNQLLFPPQSQTVKITKVFIDRILFANMYLTDLLNFLTPYRYLMIFLKFVQAVIPTIEYDYTRHFTM